MRRISGLRTARSMLTPVNAVVTQELDFQLGPRMGVEISFVVGMLTHITDSAAGTAVGAPKSGQQSLHLETDTLEDIPIDDAEDAYEMDTEAVFQQYLVAEGVEDDPNGHSTVQYTLSPNSPLVYPVRAMVTARNITHRAETTTANFTAGFAVLIGYYFVEFSGAELGLFLARRI